MEEWYEAWSPIATGDTDSVDQSYNEVATYILEDVEQAVTDDRVLDGEVLTRLGKCTGKKLTSVQSRNKSYDVSVHGCEAMSLLKVDMLQIPNHKG